jgi:hypothetical protein
LPGERDPLWGHTISLEHLLHPLAHCHDMIDLADKIIEASVGAGDETGYSQK